MKRIILLSALLFIGGRVLAQDIITKKDATEIQAKVVRVGATEIEYKQWNNPDGPLYTIPVKDVFTVKYENGQRDVLSQLESRPSKSGKSVQIKKTPRYEGDVAVGYALNVNDPGNSDVIVFETVHGVRIIPYLFAGIGTGLQFHHTSIEIPIYNKKGQITDHEYLSPIILPIFANIKGYYPTSDKFAAYFSVDLGSNIGIVDAKGGHFFATFGPGIQVGRKTKFDASLRYQHLGEKSGALLARFGVNF